MKIGEQEIGINYVSLEQFKGFLDLGKTPYDLTILERTSSMHFHITSSNKFVEEFKCFSILDWIPIIGNNVENRVINIANQRRTANRSFNTTDISEGRNLLNSPVKTCDFEHLVGCKIGRNLSTKPMPRECSSICHLSLTVNHFNFVCHNVCPLC